MDNQYKGMTVNERLYVSGLIDDYYEAVKENNPERIVAILRKVEITEESAIEQILKGHGLK